MAQMPKTIHIDPPLGGESRKFGFQKQPQYTTVYSQNFWPVNAEDGRRVSATRPPLEPYGNFPSLNCNLLCPVNGDGSQTPQVTFVTAADGHLYRWNGTGFTQIDTDYSPPLVTSNRPVYATPFLQKVIIANTGAPLVYDHAGQDVPAQRLTYLTASAGTVPQDCRIVTTWQGAVWFAGAIETPHILYASRTGDHTDFNYTALPEDEGGAFATIGDNEGLLGEPITALIPQTADTMIVGCIGSIYALRGHPRRGGSMEVLSSTIGILGQGAWAKGPDDTVYMMTKVGMVTLSPQAGAVPTEISRTKIPDELVGLAFDSTDPVISMAFDTRWNGIVITIRGDQQQSWWYDIEDGGFHRMLFDSYPTVLMTFSELDSNNTSGVMWGGGSAYGGLARMDLDGAEIIPYNLLIGPIKISPNASMKSMVTKVKMVLGLSTIMNGLIGLWVGADGEEVYQNYLQNRLVCRKYSSFQDLAYNNGITRPRMSGHAIMFQLVGEERCIFESADCDFMPTGENRRIRNWDIAPQVIAGPDQSVEFV